INDFLPCILSFFLFYLQNSWWVNSIHCFFWVSEHGFSNYSTRILHLHHLTCSHTLYWRSLRCLWLTGEDLEGNPTANCSFSRILQTDLDTSMHDHHPKQGLIDLQGLLLLW
ncbi:hypothetical protein ERO13_D13G145066v2, partial [Gossypium hirsutum]